VGQWLANTLIFAPALRQSFMDGAYWSIVYEIVFYGWVFLFIMLGLFQRRLHLIILIWLTLSLCNELVIESGALRKLLLTDESGFFAAGVLLYEIYRGRREPALFALFGFAALCAAIEAVTNLTWMRQHFGVPFDDLVVAALSLASIATVAAAVHVRTMPLPSGVVLAIGGLTYPLYLLHQHIGYIAFNAVGAAAPAGVLVTLTMAAMLLLSLATWRWIERPGQKLLKRVLTLAAERLGLAVKPAARTSAAAISLPTGAHFPWIPQTLRAAARQRR
jgi:peptidoglycan/LPS O-acetylase OafA/YrhL